MVRAFVYLERSREEGDFSVGAAHRLGVLCVSVCVCVSEA